MTDGVATFEVKIVPELEPLVRPITEAIPHPDNIRKHKLSKIAASLMAHGQRSPIVVQKSTGFICKGNGTWEAAVTLGWDRLAQSWQDFDDEQALLYLYADNKASDEATYDRNKTIAGLKKMMEGPGLFDSGWTVEDLEDMVEAEEGIGILDPQGTDARVATVTEGGEPIPDAKAPAARMKEVPVVLTLADHADFIERIKRLQKSFGKTGVIDTIVEAVRRASDEAGAGALKIGDAETIRVNTLRAARDFFIGSETQTWTRVQLIAGFEAWMKPISPLREDEPPPVAEGQVTMEEVLPESEAEPDPLATEPAPTAEPAYVAAAVDDFAENPEP